MPTPAAGPLPPLDRDAVYDLWPDLIKRLGTRLGMPLSLVERGMIAISGPNLLVITVGPSYNWVADECGADEPRAQIEKALGRLLERPMTLRFDRTGEDPRGAVAAPQGAPGSPPVRRPGDLNGDPMVQKVVQLFEARPVHLEAEEERDTPG